MKKFTVAAVAAAGLTAISLGLAAPTPAADIEKPPVTGLSDQLFQRCENGPLYPGGHSTLTCRPQLALIPVTLP
jgi:hypothetical protein